MLRILLLGLMRNRTFTLYGEGSKEEAMTSVPESDE